MSELYNINSILKQSAVMTGFASLLVALAAFLVGQGHFSLSLLMNTVLGIIALVFLVRDVQNAFQKQTLKIIQFRFIFRLACFAILLYLILVRLQMNPFGVALGLTLPVFAIMVVLFRIARKESHISDGEQ